MEELHTIDVKSKESVKNGNWNVKLSDPEVKKFGFSEAMSNKFIVTDVSSPLGHTLTLYNTVPTGHSSELVIHLNLEEIDIARIASITFQSTEHFFNNWKVELLDNRTHKKVPVRSEGTIDVDPSIEVNKLMQMGFTENPVRKERSLFELHLSKTT